VRSDDGEGTVISQSRVPNGPASDQVELKFVLQYEYCIFEKAALEKQSAEETVINITKVLFLVSTKYR
jgi:hypothetical protein